MSDVPTLVTLREIEEARAKLPSQIVHTPLLVSEDLGEAGLVQAGVPAGYRQLQGPRGVHDAEQPAAGAA
jgi:hypothetical protein